LQLLLTKNLSFMKKNQTRRAYTAYIKPNCGGFPRVPFTVLAFTEAIARAYFTALDREYEEFGIRRIGHPGEIIDQMVEVAPGVHEPRINLELLSGLIN
jgi:hypothetical protein